jgi:Predicted membrane protein
VKGPFGIQLSSAPVSGMPCAAPAPRTVGRMPPTFTTRNLRCIWARGSALALARGVPNVAAAAPCPPPGLARVGRVGVTGAWSAAEGVFDASPVARPGAEVPQDCRAEALAVFRHARAAAASRAHRHVALACAVAARGPPLTAWAPSLGVAPCTCVPVASRRTVRITRCQGAVGEALGGPRVGRRGRAAVTASAARAASGATRADGATGGVGRLSGVGGGGGGSEGGGEGGGGDRAGDGGVGVLCSKHTEEC